MGKKQKIFFIDFSNYAIADSGRGRRPYKVERLVNTDRYSAGSQIDKKEMADLIELTDVEVTIREPKDADF